MCYLYILILSPFEHIICKYFLPFHKLSFHFIDGFLCCVKAFKFNQVQLVYFCFNLICLERDIYKNIATIFVKECSALVLFQEYFQFQVLHRYLSHFEFILFFSYCIYTHTHTHTHTHTLISLFFYYFILFFNFTILYWFCHIST